MRKTIKLLVCFVILILVYPLVDSNTFRLNLAIMIGIYSLVTMGVNLLIGQAGQISLGQTALFGTGAYVSGILNTYFGLPFWICLPVSALCATTVSLLLGFSALRFTGLFLAFVTLAFVILFVEVVEAFAWLTGGTQGFSGINSPQIFGFVFNSELRYFYLVWVIVIVFAIFAHNVSRFRTGRALFSIKQNELLSNVFGISPFKYKMKIFVLSGLYAGVGGSLLAHYLRTICIEPFNAHASIIVLAMVTIGGINSGVIGGIVGASIVVILPEIISFFSSRGMIPIRYEITSDYCYHLLFFGLIMVFTILYCPRGIAGYFINLWKKVSEDQITS